MKKEINERFFRDVETVLEIQKKFRKTGTVKVLADQQQLIKELYESVSPAGSQFFTNCSECVAHALNTLESWYQRTYPKWLAEQQPKEEVMTDIELTPDDVEEAPAPKPKRKRKVK